MGANSFYFFSKKRLVMSFTEIQIGNGRVRPSSENWDKSTFDDFVILSSGFMKWSPLIAWACNIIGALSHYRPRPGYRVC